MALPGGGSACREPNPRSGRLNEQAAASDATPTTAALSHERREWGGCSRRGMPTKGRPPRRWRYSAHIVGEWLSESKGWGRRLARGPAYDGPSASRYRGGMKPRDREIPLEKRGAERRTDAEPRRYTLAGQRLEARKLAPGLHVVATPIGNLGDMTLRAIEVLAAADVIACEDTRVTRKLTDRYGIATPLTPYHDHNAAAARPKLLARLAAGEAVALVSDAGTPLISDPGFKLVRAARDAGHPVVAAPGASAALTALAVAGLPTDRFFFDGFLPAKDGQRRTRVAELARIPATLILYESGP